MRGWCDFPDREVELAGFSFRGRDKGLWMCHSRQGQEGYLRKVLLKALFAASLPAWRGVAASLDCSGEGGQGCGPVLAPRVEGGDLVSRTPPPCLALTAPGMLTPSDEEEEPLAQALCGVGHDDGCVQIAALYEHPEEVSHHEVVEDGGDAAAPDLHDAGSGQGQGLGPPVPPGHEGGRPREGLTDMVLNTLTSHPGEVRPLSFLSPCFGWS